MGVTRNVPSEGGAGGRLGHSNMDHWDYTGDIKKAARAVRRREDHLEVAAQVADLHDGEPLAEA